MPKKCKLSFLYLLSLFFIGFIDQAKGEGTNPLTFDPPQSYTCEVPSSPIKWAADSLRGFKSARMLATFGSTFDIATKTAESQHRKGNKGIVVETATNGTAINQFCSGSNGPNRPGVIFVSREMTKGELEKCNGNLGSENILQQPIGSDEVVIVTGRSNTIKSLNTESLVDALLLDREGRSSKFFARQGPTRWGQVKGADQRGGKIQLLTSQSGDEFLNIQARLTEICMEMRKKDLEDNGMLAGASIRMSCISLMQHIRPDIQIKIGGLPIPKNIAREINRNFPTALAVGTKASFKAYLGDLKTVPVTDATGLYKKPKVNFFVYVNRVNAENDGRVAGALKSLSEGARFKRELLADLGLTSKAVSYTHLTLPTKA